MCTHLCKYTHTPMHEDSEEQIYFMYQHTQNQFVYVQRHVAWTTKL